MQSIIRFAMNEIPEPETIPMEFQDILKVGRKDAEIQLFGYSWHMFTLEEWERREVIKRISGYDPLSKVRLSRVDFLTQTITEVTRQSDNKKFNFATSDTKPILRNILLTLDSKVIDELYEAFSLLEEVAQNEFERLYAKHRETLRNDFFGLPGESLRPSSLETPLTQDLPKSSEVLS
jgi:hypothetical protein